VIDNFTRKFASFGQYGRLRNDRSLGRASIAGAGPPRPLVKRRPAAFLLAFDRDELAHRMRDGSAFGVTLDPALTNAIIACGVAVRLRSMRSSLATCAPPSRRERQGLINC
jgi:hypothetical protein